MFIILLSQTTSSPPDYTPQYIGLAGTLIGTLLGWFLSYITNNGGKLDISIDNKMFRKSEKNQFGYLIKLFVYNKSSKPKHIRNLKIKFYKKRMLLLEETPRSKDSNFDFVDILSKEKIEFAFMNQFEAKSIMLCNIVGDESYIKILNADKILLFYENEKGKTKKIRIQRKFSIENISMYDKGKRFI